MPGWIGRATIFAIGLLALSLNAQATVTITDASITAGKLVVTGTSTTGTSIKLDDLYTRPISAGSFSFSLLYLPPDCMVDLSVVGFSDTAQAVVANCGPKGINPVGIWSTTKSYVVNDVVYYGGSAWRAIAANIGQQPDISTASWRVFVKAGATGLRGPKGATGARGPQGVAGNTGPQGPQGTAGTDGAQGPQGPAGANGAQGATGPQGPQGPAGSDGVQGPQGPAGADGAQGPAGPQGPSGGTMALLNGAYGVTGGGGGQPTDTVYAFIGATVTLTLDSSQRLVIETGSYQAGFTDIQTGSLSATYCYRPVASPDLTTFSLIAAQTTSAFTSDGFSSHTTGTVGFGAGAPGAAGDYEVGLCGKYVSGNPIGVLFSQVNKVLVLVTQ